MYVHICLLKHQSCTQIITHSVHFGGVLCVCMLENSGPDIALYVVQMTLVAEQVTIKRIALLLVATNWYCTGQ